MNPITSLARVRIDLDGSPLVLSGGLLTEVHVNQALNLPAVCELTFSDSVDAAMSLSAFRPGSTLRVRVDGHFTPLFTGQVTAVERVYSAANQRLAHVRAYDLLHALRKRQSVQTREQLSAVDIARDLVSALGLNVDAHADSPTWEFLIQHQPTDFDLLTELTERSGLYFTLRENTLHLLTLEGTDVPLPLTLGENLLEARLEWNGDRVLDATTAQGWNALRVESHEGSASAARSGRSTRASVSPADVNGSGERTLVNQVAQNADHAELLAQAELDRQAAREVVFSGIAEGDTLLRPGAKIEIGGVDEEFSGVYVITGATHTINIRESYVTELSTLPPVPPQRPVRSSAAVSATIGVVTAIDGELGRVRASLPAFNDVETDWMQVLSLGAGANKGLIIVPDAGDEVLILLMGGDPAQGIVLGGLFGMDGAVDPGIDDNTVRRFTFLTPGGQRLKLDDTAQTIRVENSGGSFIELTPEHVHLHAAANLTLEAPGKAIVVRGSTIDFQRE